MKKEYELYFIVKTHLEKAVYEQIAKDVQAWIKAEKGEVLFFEEEGLRDLATPIKKQPQGYYILCQFNIPPKSLKEIEHRLRVNENILRYIIVTLDSVKPRFKKKESESAVSA
eukprot:COSAG01_NODE_1433_length_10317_cov_590.337366_5_plen_113_part_00